jgi:hypothetical protein
MDWRKTVGLWSPDAFLTSCPFKPLVESSILSTLTKSSPTLTLNKLFNIILADVPEKKNDLVEGKYLVEAKKGATIAVKVADMLGKEVLVVGEE